MQPITRQRLINQRIASAQPAAPHEVLGRMGAMQAQDYIGAKWSLGLRIPGSTDAQIEQALDQASIVRTWALRGTLHLVAADDLRWLLALVAPRVIARSEWRYRQMGLDAHTLARSSELLARALEGRRRLRRSALLAELRAQGIAVDEQRGTHMLQRASLAGLICQSAAPSNDPIYIAIDSWLPQRALPPHSQALAELALRFFSSHGPATLADFIWWSGLTAAEARAGLADSAPQLDELRAGDQVYWHAGAQHADSAPQPAYLLPGFDEYLLGYTDRSAALDPQHNALVVPGNNGLFLPTIVLDGRVAGTWKRTLKKGSVSITLAPFAALDQPALQAIAGAAQRYGTYVERAAVVEA